MGMILVGTSGFQYRDWTPVLYPEGLDFGGKLRYYSRSFGCCELGFTCYRMPEPAAIQEIMEGTRGRLPLVFRVPLKLSERHPANGDLARRFVGALWPLMEAGQLAGVLARFAPEFAFVRDNFTQLLRLRDALEGIPLIAEFGFPEWSSPRAAGHLSRAGIALACIDGDEGTGRKTCFRATSSQLAYVRFQGRNRSPRLPKDGSGQHDYLYSRAELASVVPDLRRLEEECEQVLVFMNNPWRGQAVVNARMLLDLLQSPGADR